jgi:hypothetical protein
VEKENVFTIKNIRHAALRSMPFSLSVRIIQLEFLDFYLYYK